MWIGPKTCFAAVMLTLSAFAFAEKVTVLSYYDFPPFLEADGSGLSREFCRVLEAKSKGRYQFDLQIVPRLRLDAMLLQPNSPIVVPWVAPQFFPDPKRFLWGGTLMADSIVLLTQPGRDIDLTRSSTLRGLRFGGVLGHHYNFGTLEESLKQKLLTRADGLGPEQNFQNLVLGRIDLTIMGESTAHYLRNTEIPLLRGKKAPHEQILPGSSFNRTYFTLNADAALLQFLQTEIASLRVVRNTRPAWSIQPAAIKK